MWKQPRVPVGHSETADLTEDSKQTWMFWKWLCEIQTENISSLQSDDSSGWLLLQMCSCSVIKHEVMLLLYNAQDTKVLNRDQSKLDWTRFFFFLALKGNSTLTLTLHTEVCLQVLRECHCISSLSSERHTSPNLVFFNSFDKTEGGTSELRHLFYFLIQTNRKLKTRLFFLARERVDILEEWIWLDSDNMYSICKAFCGSGGSRMHSD